MKLLSSKCNADRFSELELKLVKTQAGYAQPERMNHFHTYTLFRLPLWWHSRLKKAAMPTHSQGNQVRP